jgi:hypothetical protein
MNRLILMQRLGLLGPLLRLHRRIEDHGNPRRQPARRPSTTGAPLHATD